MAYIGQSSKTKQWDTYDKADVDSKDALKADTTYVDTKVTLVEANAYDLGVGQTWQDVTASRSAGVTYTNTTGKPIFIAVSCGNTSSLYLYIDGVEVSRFDGGSDSVASCSLVVPNGSTYLITGSTFLKWSELR